MNKPPRNPKKDNLINWKLIYIAYFQIGLIQVCASMLVYFVIMANYGFFLRDLLGKVSILQPDRLFFL